MSDLQFSRAEVEALAQKLGSLQGQLSEREMQLLVAIFAAARTEVRRSSPDSGDVTVTDLRRQLLTVLIPDDGGDDFAICPKGIGW